MDALSKKTILVVDDEEHVHELIEDMLVGVCKNVLHASDGIEAAKIADENPMDIIISDLNMPGMDGLNLLGRIRWNHPQVKVVIISGAPKNIENKGAIESQGYHFLKKPFEKDELLATLADMIGAKGSKSKSSEVVPGTVIHHRENPNKGLTESEIEWNKYYSLLKEYRSEHPYKWPRMKDVYKRQKLGKWVHAQRKEFESSSGKINQSQLDKLNEIKFIWDIKESQWLEKYQELVDYREKNKDTWPRCVGSEKDLGVWCSTQRFRYKKSVENGENVDDNKRYNLLKEIGFEFNSEE